MGHEDVSTTMIYTHVLNRGGRGVRSPLDTEQLATPLVCKSVPETALDLHQRQIA